MLNVQQAPVRCVGHSVHYVLSVPLCANPSVPCFRVSVALKQDVRESGTVPQVAPGCWTALQLLPGLGPVDLQLGMECICYSCLHRLTSSAGQALLEQVKSCIVMGSFSASWCVGADACTM